MTTRIATIVRVNEDGVVYAETDTEISGFPFRKIKGYHGQSAQELGLRPGKVITVEYDESLGQIDSVLING
jgi:hypothetical protein